MRGAEGTAVYRHYNLSVTSLAVVLEEQNISGHQGCNVDPDCFIPLKHFCDHYLSNQKPPLHKNVLNRDQD